MLWKVSCNRCEGDKMGKDKNKKDQVKNSSVGRSIFRGMIFSKIIWILIIIIVVILLFISFNKSTFSSNKLTSIGFENIGELATQSAYCTEVNVTESSRELFGLTIPFTQSKYIYSYDFNIKAGFDFDEITWKESHNKITVNLPKVKVLSNEIIEDSFKVFHEEESVFTPISLEDNNDAINKMKKSAEKHAIKNGLFDNAIKNGEDMIERFIEREFDPDKYEIVFKLADE